MPPIHNGSALHDWDTHDPTLLKTQDGQYISYRTNDEFVATISNDRQTFYTNGSAFPDGLQWIKNFTNGSTSEGLWAPDIHYQNGQYYMYYSASYWGNFHSAIGLAISPSGRPGTWNDQGMVLNSINDSYNAIDPDLFVDTDGRWYLVFGSFRSGIYQYEMDPTTGMVKNSSSNPVHLAACPCEGSGMFKRGRIDF